MSLTGGDSASDASAAPSKRADHIAMFLPALSGGGAEKVFLSFAAEFLADNRRVDLVFATRDDALAGDVPSGARHIELDAGRIFRSTDPLTRYLLAERPSVLISGIGPANIAAAIARRRAARAGHRAHLVLTEHSMPTKVAWVGLSLRLMVVPLLMRCYYPNADAIVGVSNGVSDEIARLTGLKRDRIQTIYNPVITPDFSEKSAEPLEHPWFAEGEPPVILGAGRLHRHKDFPTLVRAVAHLRRNRPCRLMILGEGGERQKIEALAAKLGIADAVALPGFVSNPFPYMREAAVFALSSRTEGLANVLVEATAVGTKVVSTDCPSGPRELLKDGLHGHLAPVGDHGALAAALETSLSSPPLQKCDLSLFRSDVSARQFLRLIDRLV